MSLEIEQKWLKFRYMVFLKIINRKKFLLLGIFLSLYLILNLLEGERGLISYFEKKNILNNLSNKKETLSAKLEIIEKQNSLLTDVIDIDYLETIYRKKFMVGKKNEKVFVE